MTPAGLSNSLTSLLDALRRYRLLGPAQLEELAKQRRTDDGPQTLARELVRRGWLTAYQANQLLAGRGDALVLGPFIVLERLGEGATGQVFKARHVHMRRVVAVKIIRPELVTDGEVVARFYREIQVISRLTHPHVVHAYDAGPFGRTHFLAMEYVEGIDLARLIQQHGPLPSAVACAYVRQAALGLQHAHEKGLVHRDIKPSNLILARAANEDQRTNPNTAAVLDLAASSGGLVKVLDLGLARLACNPNDVAAATLTQAGRGMMGTPDYLAPEQAIDLRQADARSDLYSLGCTLYYLLTGQPPFPGGSLAQKLMKHQQAAPPPLTEKCSVLPADLEGIVKRLLAKEPEKRLQSAAELAEQLAPLAGDRIAVRPPPSATMVGPAPTARPQARWGTEQKGRRPRLGRKTAGAVLLGTLAVFLGWMLFHSRPAGKTSASNETVYSADDPASLALRPLLARFRRFQENGGEAPEPLRRALLDMQLDHGGTPQALAAAGMMKDLPSPLDSWNRRPTLAALGLPPDVAAVLGESAGCSWSEITCLVREGRRLAGAGPDGTVRLWDPDTLQETAALRGGTAAVLAIALAADGNTLAAADAGYTVRVWNLSAAEPRPLAVISLPAAYVHGVALTATGKVLAAASADGKIHLWDLLPSGVREREPLPGPGGWVHSVAFSPNDKMLAAGFADGKVQLWGVADKQMQRLGELSGQKPDPVVSLSFSENSQVLACSSQRTGQVHICYLAEKPPQSTTLFHQNQVAGISLSPDGKKLAVAVPEMNAVRIWNLDGARWQTNVLLRGHAAPVQAVAFGPDGKTIYSASQDRTVRAWDLSANPPGERPLVGLTRATAGGPTHFALSSDGLTLATHARADLFLQLWDINAASPRPRARISLPSIHLQNLTFSPDGKRLGAIVDAQPFVWDLGTANPRQLFLPAPTGRALTLAFGPGGRLAIGGAEPSVRLWQLGVPHRELAALSTDGVTVISLAFTPDGKTLAALGTDRKARLWNLGSGSPESRSPLDEPTDQPSALGFSSDGKLLAFLGSADGRTSLWDWSAAPPKIRLNLGGLPPCRIRALAVSPDGRMIATAGDGTEPLALWDLATGKKRRSWTLPGQVLMVEFGPDSRHLLTANGNGTLYLFRLGSPAAVAKK